MHTRFLVASVLLCGVVCGACHVDAKVNASTGENEALTDRSDEPMTAAATPTPVAAPVAVPTTPPSDACPLTCFEARGSERGELTTEENAQLRTALEPVIGRMRTCTSPEDWRRHGSPVVNLRIGADGTLSELGVDPHHGRDTGCFDDAARSTSVSVALPGRKVVRCVERCVRERRAPGRRRSRRPAG
jgi:hypothetical protein